MVNPNPPSRTEAYESGILAQLIKNAERLAVIESQNSLITTKIQKIDELEKKVGDIESQVSQITPEVQKISKLEKNMGELEKKINVIYGSLKWVFTMLGTIILAIIANIFSQPILNWFSCAVRF